jgi:putative redox protein
MREVSVKRGKSGAYQQAVTAGSHTLAADVPASLGGDDAGPDPHEYLAVALGTCTAITVEMYARRKGLALDDVEVRVTQKQDGETLVMKRDIRLLGKLTDEQRQRLLEIANRCPIHQALAGHVRVESALV